MSTQPRLSRGEIAAEALDRARNGQSFANYGAVYEGFAAKGIPAEEIEPRVNVLTYHAWRALGRQVRKGEHGVKVVTYREDRVQVGAETPLDPDGVWETRRRMTTATVFHVTQTDPIGGAA